jgi:hypothetical protein
MLQFGERAGTGPSSWFPEQVHASRLGAAMMLSFPVVSYKYAVLVIILAPCLAHWAFNGHYHFSWMVHEKCIIVVSCQP